LVTYVNRVPSWTHPFMEYHGLSTDTKPTDAPVNAKFVELDTGASFYFYNGTWNAEPAQGSASGGSLPANFPAEDAANANKFLGFDASGDYAALDAPSGAEKFVVTLTEDDSGDDPVWTADKTIEEIAEAAEANQVVVVSFPLSPGMSGELPLFVAMYTEDNGGAIFNGFVSGMGVLSFKTVIGSAASGTDSWVVNDSAYYPTPNYSSSNNGQVLGIDNGDLAWVDPASSATEKFVVTLTEDNDTWTAGETTIAEIIEAYEAGQVVVAKASFEGVPMEIPILWAGEVTAEVNGCIFNGVLAVEPGYNYVRLIMGFTQSGITSWTVDDFAVNELPFYSSANNGQVLGVDNGDLAWVTPESGVSSWNNLEDRPFYATTAAGFDYPIDLNDSYVSGYIYLDANTGLPCRFYRVSDPLTAEQLIDATVVIDTGDGIDSIEIAAAAIHEIEDNDETIALFVCDEIPTVLVINADNTVINTTAEENVLGLSVQFASAGTYLLWIDLSAMEPDCVAYVDELYKEDVTTVVPLPDQYYNPSYPVIIRPALNNGYDANRSLDNILDAYQNGKHVYALIDLTSTLQLICPLCGIWADDGIVFYGSMQIDNAVYAVTITISGSDGVVVEWSTWACSVSSSSDVSNAFGGS